MKDFLRAALLLLSFAPAADARADALDPSFPFACSPLPGVGCSGLFATREGDSSLALLAGGDSLSARLRSLFRARRSIRIQALIFSGDESGLRVAEILKDKRRAHPGMDIRVIVDAMSNPDLQTQWMYYDLKQHGIEVEGYEALYLQLINEASVSDPLRINKRFHDKMWAIDSEEEDGVAIIGGLNVANEYFRVKPDAKSRWRDQDAILRGRVVRDVAQSFDRNYSHLKEIKASRPDLLNTDKAWGIWRKVIERTWRLPMFFKKDPAIARAVSDAEKTDPVLRWRGGRMRYLQSRPRYGETYLSQAYRSFIEGSSRPGGEILLASAYFIPEPDLISSLRSAARAGARVVVLTNSLETNDLPELTYASRYLYAELIEAGVEIHEYVGAPFGEGTMHSKFGVFDRGKAIVGSYNLDARSEHLNSENAVLFEDPESVNELADGFLSLDLPKSRRIHLPEALAWRDPRGLDAFRVRLMLELRPML